MAFHNTQEKFGPFSTGTPPKNLTVQANGGSVNIEIEVAPDVWITPADLPLPYTTDVSVTVEVAECHVRITPLLGAIYNFGAGV